MNLGTVPGFETNTDACCTSNYVPFVAAATDNSPFTSYLYRSSDRKHYAFDDPEMDKFSYIPATEINGKTVIFTINRHRAIFYDTDFYFSLPELLKKIKLPQTLDQELLDKIAIIANYLAQGKECEYVEGSAKQEDQNLQFFVKNGMDYCKVKLCCFMDDATIIYEKVESHSSFTTDESFFNSSQSTTSSIGRAIKASRSRSDETYVTDRTDRTDRTDSEEIYF